MFRLHDTELLSESLLSFYTFTECDTVSVFCVKEKLNAKVMLKNQKCINEFSGIRDNPDISDEQLEILQTFLFVVDGHKPSPSHLGSSAYNFIPEETPINVIFEERVWQHQLETVES